MPMQVKEIEAHIQEAFPDAIFELTRLVDDDDHWALSIQSKTFVGRTRIQQHKMVHEALKGKMGTDIHALQLKTKAL